MANTELPLDVKLMALATQLLLGVFALLSLGAVATWAVRHPVWTVKGIVVAGDVSHQNAVTLRAQLATQMRSRLSSSFLTIDLQQVREMFEQVAWVRRAVVQRDFPNRLRVTIEEHQPVAWWGEAGSGQLVNTLGEVFDASPDDADNLPELVGPAGRSADVWALFQTLQPVFARIDLGIERLELGERGSWRAHLHNGADIDLGRGTPDELTARVQRFVGTLPQLTERYAGPLLAADLRYPNGYALRIRGVTTDNAPTPTSKR
ncbi:MAG: cell division protein FtsQ/DivIB [Hydrogenophaga sp.]|uniref:cell division protein FtsQ/DivIB n=1 Tax=Hydrogenophaga sp. TaxID=1904254 RepID=UPI001DD16C8B|nr:cell division protein FtsQ/DivIB [Hydrogenophaga sp.]MBX3610645.1 cell division protein FtsQ/DivIB [Hydrogenophaga sp.]